MTLPAISRIEMIGRLVEHAVAEAVAESPRHWLRNIFENGFVGYSRLSDRQLRTEMEMRGLAVADEPAFDEDDDVLLSDLQAL